MPEFAQPLALVLLVLLPGVLILGRSRARSLGRYRGPLLLGLRLFETLALVLAAADIRIQVPDSRVSVVFALDVSDSVPPEQQAIARDWIRQAVAAARPDDRAAVVSFGGQPSVETVSVGGGAPGASVAESMPGATDVAATLRLAGALTAGGGQRRIVLLSDGWQTQGDARAELAGLSRQAIQVSYVPLVSPTSGPEVALQTLEAPGSIRDGDPAELSVVIASNVATQAHLSLSSDGQSLIDEPIAVSPGMNRLGLTANGLAEGGHTLAVEVQPTDDTLAQNNRREAFVVVGPAPRILIIEPTPGAAEPLRAMLSAEGMGVEVQGPAAISPEVGGLEGYDAIALDNVPATSLSLDQQMTLRTFVRDLGHGLAVFGGAQSFSMGAYSGTTLEDMLPVSAAPPPRQTRGDLALALVVDQSGSMDLGYGGVTKMQMARQAASQVTQQLKPDDLLGVLAFNTAAQWVVPIRRVGDSAGVADIQARIATIKAGGGTEIYPALQAAYQALAHTDARYKHVLLLTDGQSKRGDYDGLVTENRALGATMSTLGIGSDTNRQLLAHLADLGAGRTYFTDHPADIPALVIKEASIAGRSSLTEGEVRLKPAEASPLLQGLVLGQAPPLAGYVETSPKRRATVALVSDEGDPILAHWLYGLGRVVAWTSAVDQTWAGPWLAWGGAGTFFGNALRWMLPPAGDARLQVRAHVAGNQITLGVDSLHQDGTFADGLETRATIVTPRNQAIEVSLPQSAPGQYERTLTVDEPGLYEAAFRQVDVGGMSREQFLGFEVDGHAELREVGTNEDLLRSIADQTGGRRLTRPSDAYARDDGGDDGALPTTSGQLWPWLLAGAMLGFTLDIALRRLRPPVSNW